MRPSQLAVTLLLIFINSFEQRVALDDENPGDFNDNYDDEANLVNTETWEENFNAETTFIDESNLKDPDECGDPPPVRNAMIFQGKQTRYEVGAKVTYACEFGYITDGLVHYSECLLSDVTQTLYWTDSETRCSPRSCGDPGYVDHAHRVGSVFTFPNKISFECDDGYIMRGYGIRYCQTSGTWSGSLPTCELVFCDPPENPENGKVFYSSLGYESELRYQCDPGFILKNNQGRICSANGTWSGNEPTCLEAQCDPPPAPEHGNVQVIGEKSSVGSRALYTCDEGRVLVGSASSKCLDIGEWTFPTPRCLEPCFIPKLEHGKIGRYVGYYRRRFEELSENSKIEDGEELHFRCEPNYEPFGNPETEEKITCSQGEWEAVPVCKPAMCRGPPPPTPNAIAARANKTHGGGVVYHCRQFAKKVKFGNTTCSFGTWKGDRPVCKDLRCSVDELSFPGLVKGKKKFYLPDQLFNVTCERGFNITKENNQLKCVDGTWQGHLPPCIAASCNAEDLVESEGIVPGSEKVILNGEYLTVRCREGYSPSGKQARCSRGQWNVKGKLCQESSCTVHGIDNGGFSRRVEKKQLTWSLTYDRWYEYPRLNLGGKRDPGSWIYASCDDGYSFQGKRGENHVSVQCSKGKWDPDPVCLITGTPYRKKASVSLEKAEESNTRKNIEVNRSPSTTRQPFLLTTQRPSESDAVIDLDKKLEPTPYPSCTCTYRSVDDNLVAFVGTEQLSYGSKVKNNDKIKFHCRHLGYSRLNGVPEIKCEKCRSWHSSEFPDCTPPKLGDTILQFEGEYTILPGGIIGVEEGKQLAIRCASIGKEEYPKLATSTPKTLLYSNYRDERGLFLSIVNISNAASQHNGKYFCYIKGFRASAFDIQVISQHSANSKSVCSKFDDKDFIIHYDKEQAVNSTALFFCRDNHKKLNGQNAVTCLVNGQWSGGTPECKTVCPEIKETDGMSISYTKGVDEGSVAGFHCLEPRKRTGVPWTTCKENGEWADPPAKCTLSSCPLDQLFDVVPANVVPVMEDVASDTLPYNFTLRLTCENDMMLSGSDVAKCGQDGKWQVSKVQCISGCVLPKIENSELIIEPNKSFYRFGESVALSCSPGYVLNSEVVRLMCMGNSWSENVPECRKE
ncbi:unnamed protein product [Larinioides sclopetarius]|uniref:Sushi domain-containing protein n=1 Tax=Larinioides sclopetarius TaxID=280406 RepID=A0AAV1ZT14_9ARAC